MESGGARPQDGLIKTQTSDYFDESDQSSIHESDLDLTCFSTLRRTKKKKSSKLVKNGAIQETKANMSQEKEKQRDIKRVEDTNKENAQSTSGGAANVTDVEPQSKDQGQPVSQGNDIDARPRKSIRRTLGSLLARASLRKNDAENEKRKSMKEAKRKSTPKSSRTLDSITSLKDEEGSQSEQVKKPEPKNEIDDNEVKTPRRTLGSLFSQKKRRKEKSSFEADEAEGGETTVENRPSKEKPRRTLGSLFSIKKNRNSIDSEKAEQLDEREMQQQTTSSSAPIEFADDDKTSIGQISTVIKVERLSDEPVYRKPFGLLSEETFSERTQQHQSSSIKGGSRTSTDDGTEMSSSRPRQVLTEEKQEHFKVEDEMDAKVLNLTKSQYVAYQDEEKNDVILTNIKQERLSELEIDAQKLVALHNVDHKPVTILVIKKENNDFLKQYVNVGMQTDPIEWENFLLQNYKNQLPPGSTDESAPEDVAVKEEIPPVKIKSKTTTSIQTDCACNNDSSIEQMNNYQRDLAIRTGSMKQNKLVQTDICMCNYISSTDDD